MGSPHRLPGEKTRRVEKKGCCSGFLTSISPGQKKTDQSQKTKERNPKKQQQQQKTKGASNKASSENTISSSDVTLYAERGTPAGAIVLLAAEHSNSKVNLSATPLSDKSKSPVQLKAGGGLFLDQPLSVASFLSASDAVFSGRCVPGQESDAKSQSEVLQWFDFARGEVHHIMCAYMLGQKQVESCVLKKV